MHVYGSTIPALELELKLAIEKCKENPCSINCDSIILGNGVCDEECNNANCNFDEGDCGKPCAPKCLDEMLGDGVC